MKAIPFFESIPQYAGAGVYCIRNLETGACYIGASKHIRARLSEHASFLRAGYGNRRLCFAFLLREPLVADVIEPLARPSEFDLRDCERKWIGQYLRNGVELYNDAPVPPGRAYYEKLLKIAEQRGDTRQIRAMKSDIARLSS